MADAPGAIILTEGPPGWWCSPEPEAVELARRIPLPTLSQDGAIVVCLPWNLMPRYREIAAAAGVTLLPAEISAPPPPPEPKRRTRRMRATTEIGATECPTPSPVTR